jgi:hypothetical protein
MVAVAASNLARAQLAPHLGTARTSHDWPKHKKHLLLFHFGFAAKPDLESQI